MIADRKVPTIYIFHGDDEFAIHEAVKELKAKQEDGGFGGLNIASLEGKTLNLDELRNAVMVLPFLSGRRLVVVGNALARFGRQEEGEEGLTGGNPPGSKERQEFLKLLEDVPVSTGLVLVVEKMLDDTTLSRRVKRDHWLVKWAKDHPDRAFCKGFELPRGQKMADWIRQRANRLGGSIHPEAAEELATLVGSDARQAESEIAKLLAYVNFSRQIDYEDVVKLTTHTAEADIFAMVDALGEGNAQRAMDLLGRLLETEDESRIFGMVVRQFRLLTLTKECQARGTPEAELPKILGVPGFVASKLLLQARRFSTADLDGIYHRLLEIDLKAKTSQIEIPLALSMLLAATAR